MIINHNLNALNTFGRLASNNVNASKNMEKLSSGLRINRAADDAAGLNISEKMRGQIRGLEQGSRNAQDGISLIQTADGALGEAQAVIQRMRELAVQGSNDTNEGDERKAINTELSKLTEELNSIKNSTQFNGKNLLSGNANTVTFQTGANSGQNVKLDFDTAGIDLTAVNSAISGAVTGIKTKTTSGTVATADYQTLIKTLDDNLKSISNGRSELGATQNRLEYAINKNSNAKENLQSAEARIRDVDMAKEMMEFTKNNILSQAAQSMLSQANQQPQNVLQLLR